MTAIGTVRADDPQMTCRVGRHKDPVRIVIDPKLEINPDARILSCPPDTIIVTRYPGSSDHKTAAKKNTLLDKGIKIIDHAGERPDLGLLMKELGSMGIMSVLTEGGSSLNSYCLESGIVDKVMFFMAPKIIGGKESFTAVGGKSFRTLSNALRIKDMKIKRLGEDILIEGYLQK
jgi:diaminohydroxyphosphoribosylaminopyrimidine deaminase/5-amino-6-(5-phosphoribosylamino)uracil reductase